MDEAESGDEECLDENKRYGVFGTWNPGDQMAISQ